MRFIGIFVLVFFFLSLSGCASIVSDSKYPVSFSSTPSDAQISIEDDTGQTIYSGETPTTVSLDSSEGFFQPAEYVIRIEKEGYSARQTTVKGDLDGWYIGNLAFGGLIGWIIVDPATGAMWKLNEKVNVSLSKDNEDTANSDRKIRIISLKDVPHEAWSKMEKID